MRQLGAIYSFTISYFHFFTGCLLAVCGTMKNTKPGGVKTAEAKYP